MSGSIITATAKARRPYMPDEYVRMGMSMNSSSSANATMSSYFSASCSRFRPAASPPSTTLSRPESFRLKPTPSASSVLTRPWTSTRPSLGGRIPAIVRTSVDLPAPLAPTMPRTVPCGTSKVTLRTASISRTIFSRRPSFRTVERNVGARSRLVRYVTETSSTEIAVRSETDSELTLPGEEEQAGGQEQPDAPPEPRHHRPALGRLAPDEHVAPRRQQAGHRVDVEQPLVALRDLVREVEDRRDVEPHAQHVGQEVGEVAEVHLAGGHEHRETAREQEHERHDRHHVQQGRVDRQP